MSFWERVDWAEIFAAVGEQSGGVDFSGALDVFQTKLPLGVVVEFCGIDLRIGVFEVDGQGQGFAQFDGGRDGFAVYQSCGEAIGAGQLL